jgi:hypothetical protein
MIHLYVAIMTWYHQSTVHWIKGQCFDTIAGSECTSAGQLQEATLANCQHLPAIHTSNTQKRICTPVHFWWYTNINPLPVPKHRIALVTSLVLSHFRQVICPHFPPPSWITWRHLYASNVQTRTCSSSPNPPGQSLALHSNQVCLPPLTRCSPSCEKARQLIALLWPARHLTSL